MRKPDRAAKEAARIVLGYADALPAFEQGPLCAAIERALRKRDKMILRFMEDATTHRLLLAIEKGKSRP